MCFEMRVKMRYSSLAEYLDCVSNVDSVTYCLLHEPSILVMPEMVCI